MDTKKLNLMLKGLTALIFVVGLVLSFMVISNGDPRNVDAEQLGIVEWNKQYEAHKKQNGDVPFASEKTPQEMGDEIAEVLVEDITGTVSTTINFTMIVLYACIIISLITFVIALISDFKRFKPFLIGAIVLLVIVGISYAMASDVVPQDLTSKIDTKTYKLVGTGLLTTFILTFLAALVWIAGEALKLFR
ncbi:MAG: hypothetical protein ACLGGV_05535 [Bacteroidia bacterium]